MTTILHAAAYSWKPVARALKDAGAAVACLASVALVFGLLDSKVDASGAMPDRTRSSTSRLGDPATPPPALPEMLFKAVTPEQAIKVNASIPLVPGPVEAARSFKLKTGSQDYARALECLTSAIYYESAHEGSDGQRGVAQVILNRARHPAFPASVCGVVYQGFTRSTGCQFTFTCDGSLQRAPSQALWAEARKIAAEALTGEVLPAVGTATHYHADYVVPYWAWSLAKSAQIGRHIFYRWPDGAGRKAAFRQRYSGEAVDPLQLRTAALASRRTWPAPVGPAREVAVTLIDDPQLDLLSVVHLLADTSLRPPGSDAVRSQLRHVSNHPAVHSYRAILASEGTSGFPFSTGFLRSLASVRPSAGRAGPSGASRLAVLKRDLVNFAASGSYVSLRSGKLLREQRKTMQRDLASLLNDLQRYSGIDLQDVRLTAVPVMGTVVPLRASCLPLPKGVAVPNSRSQAWLVQSAASYVSQRSTGRAGWEDGALDCVTDLDRQLVAAMVSRIADQAMGPAEAKRQLAREVAQGHRLVPQLADRLRDFEKDRYQFTNIGDYRDQLTSKLPPNGAPVHGSTRIAVITG
ncbi:MAG TPA: cell wall hydrolase [Sphingomicrobium sp.]|nr:cell wall hydrolase [Sphingomicrobium sp.]